MLKDSARSLLLYCLHETSADNDVGLSRFWKELLRSKA